MKPTIVTLLLLWSITPLFSQEVFRPGIVKGKNVTYHVSIKHIYNYYIKNTANDTTVRWGYDNDWLKDSILMKQIKEASSVVFASGGLSLDNSQREELELQLAEIFHKHLSPEELQLLKKTKDQITICVRIDPEHHNRLKQVTYFYAINTYLMGLQHPDWELSPETYDGFWLNFNPDKLHEIEKDIVKQTRVPEGVYEVELTEDFPLTLYWNQIYDPGKAKKEHEEEAKQRMIELRESKKKTQEEVAALVGKRDYMIRFWHTDIESSGKSYRETKGYLHVLGDTLKYYFSHPDYQQSFASPILDYRQSQTETGETVISFSVQEKGKQENMSFRFTIATPFDINVNINDKVYYGYFTEIP